MIRKPFWIGLISLRFTQLAWSEIVVSAMKDLRQLTIVLSIREPFPESFVASGPPLAHELSSMRRKTSVRPDRQSAGNVTRGTG